MTSLCWYRPLFKIHLHSTTCGWVI